MPFEASSCPTASSSLCKFSRLPSAVRASAFLPKQRPPPPSAQPASSFLSSSAIYVIGKLAFPLHFQLQSRTASTITNPSFPATKAQLYGTARPTYYPQPHHRRSHCRCCCTFYFWLILIILILLLLIGLAGVALYVIYHPHRPSFIVTSLKLSYLNLTSSSTLDSKFDLNITVKNPNNKIDFFYKPTSISIMSDDVDIDNGTIPAFEHGKKNTMLLKASIFSHGQNLDSDAATQLKKNMKSKNGLSLKVRLETKVKVKMGNLKTPRVGIRVSCEGIKVNLPTGKKPASALTSNAKCNVEVGVNIWKWTVG